jgi:voltage-dependent calcium channel L type alpha-1D
MILSVVVNTVVLGMDRFDIDKSTETILGFMNSVFTYIFIIELTMKLIAVGPSRYLSDKMNYMDGGVVLMSIVELVINSLNTNGKGGSSLSAFRTIRIFRTFRVLRVARLLRALDSMQVIIAVIQRSIM